MSLFILWFILAAQGNLQTQSKTRAIWACAVLKTRKRLIEPKK
jgi:hypothetical protein